MQREAENARRSGCKLRTARSAPRSHSLDWNNIGDKGASALATILEATQITKLRCAAPRSRLVSAPCQGCSITILARSLDGNPIGDRGASALAAVLKETRISQLKCAATPSVRFCVCAR